MWIFCEKCKLTERDTCQISGTFIFALNNFKIGRLCLFRWVWVWAAGEGGSIGESEKSQSCIFPHPPHPTHPFSSNYPPLPRPNWHNRILRDRRDVSQKVSATKAFFCESEIQVASSRAKPSRVGGAAKPNRGLHPGGH